MAVAPRPGFAVIYRWRVDPAKEAQFIEAWSAITAELMRDGGSLGSRLHRGSDGLWYGYAQWPSAQTREAAFAQPRRNADAAARMNDALLERLPEIRLESVADFLLLPD